MLQVIMYQRLVACTTAKSFVLAAHLINGLIHGQLRPRNLSGGDLRRLALREEN
jgi:hypothetical protein